MTYEGPRDLPHLADVRLPPQYGQRPGRWLGRRLLSRFDLRVHGTEHIPASGPVLLVSNHVGFTDGPMVWTVCPRQVLTLTKHEMFTGPAGVVLRLVGQVPIVRYGPDVRAMTSSLKGLSDGRVVCIFPEGSRGDGLVQHTYGGAAYLALVSGAPVVTVACLGTRLPGHGSHSIPPRGSRLDTVFGPPFSYDAEPWPRTKQRVEEVRLDLQDRLASHVRDACDSTGHELPGPLPVGDSDRTG